MVASGVTGMATDFGSSIVSGLSTIGGFLSGEYNKFTGKGATQTPMSQKELVTYGMLGIGGVIAFLILIKILKLIF